MPEHNPHSKSQSNWPQDEFGRSEMYYQLWFIGPVFLAFVFGVGWLLFSAVHRGAKRPNQVIVYCAQDQVYAEPVFKTFEKQTGIKVRAVYDNEAVKTVGLANRLLAERSHPQCDVFWGNEEMRTRQLAAQGVFGSSNGWAAFGYRSRRIVINTNFVSERRSPNRPVDNTPQKRADSEIGA